VVARVERRERLLEVRRASPLELDPRGQAGGAEVAGHLAQQRERLRVLAARVQQARERYGRVRARGLERDGAPQRRLVARGHERVRLRRQQRVEERVDRGARLRADELRDDAAVLERLHGGDALDPEGTRDRRVRVGVELRERDLALARADRLLQHGRELAARAAPRRPEVDDDGKRARALDDLRLEVLLGDVEDHLLRVVI
jgi:hypothetical protein